MGAELITTPGEMRAWSREARRAGERIGFVATMGALHEGHRNLARAIRTDVDRLVFSVFVNPLQFGSAEDLESYPRTLQCDRDFAEEQGADCVFAPSTETMYAEPVIVSVVPGILGERWEGASRPGHFEGVLTVVAKLFHIIEPDVAVFGRKDYQQALCIQRMVSDLSLGVEIRVVQTVREPDGLALSSRNVHLSDTDRTSARALSSALREMEALWRNGETAAGVLLSAGRACLGGQPGVEVDYIALADAETLAPVEQVDERTVALVAARVGSTRLIDNLILGEGFAADQTASV